MRHGMANKKLNRTSEHRKALLMNMLNSLIKYEQITTTLPKAKFLKPQADKIITLGKKNTLQNTRLLISKLQSTTSANKVKNLSYPTVLTYALSQWKVDIKQVLNLLLWTWLENQVIVAIKLIPIGHSAGQKIFFELEADFEKAINQALETDQSDWSNFHPMQSMACAKHQFQYSRMFRS